MVGDYKYTIYIDFYDIHILKKYFSTLNTAAVFIGLSGRERDIFNRPREQRYIVDEV